MHALLIVAHGSRLQSYSEEIDLLVSRLKGQLTNFDQIEYAFLELAEPGITKACDHLIDSGASRISIFPYFLAAGRHITEDIPDEVNKVSASHTEVEISLLDYFGSTENIFNALCQELKSQS